MTGSKEIFMDERFDAADHYYHKMDEYSALNSEYGSNPSVHDEPPPYEDEPELLQLINNNYPVSKSAIEQQAMLAVDAILEKGNALEAVQMLKSASEFIEQVRGNTRLVDNVRDELLKYPKGKVTLESGTRVECAEVGTEYDYSQCNDPELRLFQESLEKFKLAVKERQAFLRTVPASGVRVLFDDEIVTVYPPSKKSTSSFKVTLRG